jgi:hypothetical protein
MKTQQSEYNAFSYKYINLTPMEYEYCSFNQTAKIASDVTRVVDT